MLIEHVRIRNFRSLRDLAFDPKPLTVLVGSNDEGKSNVLRALDLFFNHDKPGNHQLVWERDYCAFAAKRNRRAEEIEISLTLRLPENYSLTEPLKWTRTWRKEGFYHDEVQTASGNALPGRSRADAFLRAIRFDYVPAVKGADYFQRLLSAVYDMLDATVQNSIRGAATGFTSEIGQHTQSILDELASRLDLRSHIRLPSDLRPLFSELQFHSERYGYAVTLAQRGDGIKVRHIPIILRWLAEQANHLAARGRPRVVTIWGYEEPENNLEIRRAFELAKEFQETSNTIPTFLTTHSPVFYSAFKDAAGGDVGIHEVAFEPEAGTIVTAQGSDDWLKNLDSATGLLELLEPHVKKWKRQVRSLKKTIRAQGDLSKPTIFVEGPTEVIVLNSVIERFFPEDHARVVIRASEQNGGGHAWVKDSLVAWHYRRATAKAVGLFDSDDATKKSMDEFRKLVTDHVNGGSSKAYALKVMPAGISQKLRQKHFHVPVALEELYPGEAWLHAEKQGWLKERFNLPGLYKFQRIDISFRAHVDANLTDEADKRLAMKCVPKEHKEKLAKFVARKIKDGSVTWDFNPLIENMRTVLTKLR